MNHETRSEQYNKALEAAHAHAQFRDLLELVRELGAMPHPDFQDRLKAEIERAFPWPQPRPRVKGSAASRRS